MQLSPTSIRDIVAHRTVEDLGSYSIVKIPKFSALSDQQCTAVALELSLQDNSPPLDVDALEAALLDLPRPYSPTPPLDEEADWEESRVLEQYARTDLKEDGCPPCYPCHLGVPIQNPPEEYLNIISYWKSLPGTGDVVLCAQLSDWRTFRKAQLKARDAHSRWQLTKLEEELRQRQRRYGVDGEVQLQMDPSRQNRLENWIEYQNYQLQRHEVIEKGIRSLRNTLKIAHGIDSGQIRRDIDAYRERLEAAEWQLEMHDLLLQWIDQERALMDTRFPPAPLSCQEESQPLPKSDSVQRHWQIRSKVASVSTHVLTRTGRAKVSRRRGRPQEEGRGGPQQ